ncbi:MAG: L-2-amino-thiazoline-4-carboxylic acid hydrolase [Desulfobacterales bacterium]|nr:L-2-amino-thiazoline-4-carboxylic acid hydrolase [Desulfobacterales bacterium]
MEAKVDQIPSATKWAMATKGLTGALAAHLNAIYEIVGKDKYAEIIRHIWGQIGEGSAAEVKLSDMPVGNAKSVGEAGVTTCICAMGPEYKIEQVETTKDKTVMKITECPWQNRMKELGISHDLLSACDIAFWRHFTRNLNPNVTMRHGKQMHRGDPYCEWIFETR